MLQLRSRIINRRSPGRSGFTRAELVVFAAILLILVAVLWVPISNHFEQASITRAVESARTINTVLSQYANDNNGVYPIGEGTPAAGKSEGIALNLLQNNYVPDATVFAVGSTAKYAGKASDFSDITAANLSWDFTAGATATTGLTTSAPDLLPTVYTTGQTVDYSQAKGHGLILEPNSNGPLGLEGIVVAYKAGNARFIPAPEASGTASAPPFIEPGFTDPGPYTQIKP
jgi:type II secretory pathway pseudopilin PulG